MQAEAHAQFGPNEVQLRRSRDLAHVLNSVLGDGWKSLSVAATVPKLVAMAVHAEAGVVVKMFDVRSEPADDAIYYYEATYNKDSSHTGGGDTPLLALIDLRNKWRIDLAELARKVDDVSACLPGEL